MNSEIQSGEENVLYLLLSIPRKIEILLKMSPNYLDERAIERKCFFYFGQSVIYCHSN